MATLRVGGSLDKSIDIGAIVDPVQLERIRSLVETGKREGCAVWQAQDGTLPTHGCFYPPTLVTGVAPASLLAQEEIFGPVLVAMSFRTPDEAVALANNSRYGLAASVWSETIGRALDIAPRLACGVVWINATNLFDAAVGFGGYRESGYGREGGREGIHEYLKPRAWLNLAERKAMPPRDAARAQSVQSMESMDSAAALNVLAIDRTAKLFIGGKQVRPDSGYSLPVYAADGTAVGEVGEGNRKDIRNAVEAARAAQKWSQSSAHNRAQVLFYLAENLAVRADEFARQLVARNGTSTDAAHAEVEASITRLFTYAAWADKFDGAVHTPPLRGVALAMHEPLGVIGIACAHEMPLLGFVSLVAPALAMGNRVVVLPSETCPLTVTDFYQVAETSDVPGGVLNIVTGERAALLPALARHNDVDALWCFGRASDSTLVERESVGNLKRTFTDYGRQFDWFDPSSEGVAFLRQAVQVKNVWVPYGD
jgi:aldehyde dehydrogenase (NAD+)